MSPEEIMALFSQKRVGRLGCIAGMDPYVVPINYLIDGESIYCHSLAGKKIMALRSNPRACVQVDDVQDSLHWRSGLAFGVYEELSDPLERERIARRFLESFPRLTPVESVPEQGPVPAETIVFRIKIVNLSGAKEG
jgi:nitroimidazol reductase NimA-like FMN-containing flavoprotein (pyridoxamine 5'-phosphate oxidase superfamily)